MSSGKNGWPRVLPYQATSTARMTQTVALPMMIQRTVFVLSPTWARLGSNQRPLACEASALPLSYAP